jgi:hypothetical protein
MSAKAFSVLFQACIASGVPVHPASLVQTSYLNRHEKPYAQNIGTINHYIDTVLAGSQKVANRNSKKVSAFRARLDEYADLVSGWDGDEGVAPSGEALRNMRALFDYIVTGGYPIPDPAISSEGEVGLYWRQNSIYINLEVGESGEYSFYGQDAKGGVKFIDELPISAGLSSEVVSFICLLQTGSEIDMKSVNRAISKVQGGRKISRKPRVESYASQMKSYFRPSDAVNDHYIEMMG